MSAPPSTPSRRPTASLALVAVAALLVGFVSAAQFRSQLVTPYNRVDRNAALVRSVQGLERTNQADRDQVTRLRAEIDSLEAAAAQRSDQTSELRQQAAELRAHAGLVAVHGPGVTVTVANGRPSSDGQTGYLATYEDIQDVVNLLFTGGAEAIAVNGRRITPVSSYQGSPGTVEIDQGLPLTAPFHIVAIGNRNAMQQLLGDPGTLGDLRERQHQFGVQLGFSGSANLRVPAFDGSLELPDVHAG